ncbi:hypothetical protein BCR43DRAFT_508951 [Syncephalastrum racemosum]|uniref:Uncharacterized protein n=1 Tax=Syncephalastrum racemosum TaxID=13706 RepID=A0A1X2H066_SYNRA|nr:hypothetical protein BCR43DRAFT_508951 [Syncephalastrum racemosum]
MSAVPRAPLAGLALSLAPVVLPLARLPLPLPLPRLALLVLGLLVIIITVDIPQDIRKTKGQEAGGEQDRQNVALWLYPDRRWNQDLIAAQGSLEGLMGIGQDQGEDKSQQDGTRD